jgi:hypothetical protein
VCDADGQCATPPVTTCASGFCNASGSDCLTCGAGQAACAGACCAAGQGCCNDTCAALDTATNCGVCGNACATGKVCSGTQCLWEDGKICANGADCASGVCGGRCCPAGTSCSCTQPSGGNIQPNPGFDKDVSGWNIFSSEGTVEWVSGPLADGPFNGDAESCPFSGGLYAKCAPPADYCYPQGPCVEIKPHLTYNFGYRQAWGGGGGGHFCGFYVYPGTNCTGNPRMEGAGFSTADRWSMFQFASFEAGESLSARAYCEVDVGGPNSAIYVDMMFLSAAPGGY